MSRGQFITLEGGEGTGKSTQIGLLLKALKSAGIDVVQTREPGGSPGAEAIRRLLVEGDTEKWDGLTEVLLNYAARHEHLRHTITPALDVGRWVISDRFADSTVAYQGYGHGFDRAVIERIHDLVVGSIKPDLTLVLDISVEQGISRARSRSDNEDRYERMDLSFHERVRQGFLEISTHDPDRCVLIDASKSIDQVHADINAAILARLGVTLT